MSYMTAGQTTALGEFMEELQALFNNSKPPALDFDININVSKSGGSIGTISKISNATTIVFVPAGPNFEGYEVPKNKVGE